MQHRNTLFVGRRVLVDFSSCGVGWSVVGLCCCDCGVLVVCLRVCWEWHHLLVESTFGVPPGEAIRSSGGHRVVLLQVAMLLAVEC